MYHHQSSTPLSAHHSSMSVTGIQGQSLEVTVVACNKLKDTEWFSRQDPYVCVEYGSTKFRTRTCTDGGKNPTFQEKFVFNLIEGLRELSVVVWNSNTITVDDFIGSGKVQLQKVLSQGYDDSSWPIQTKTGRHAGEIRLIMHFDNSNKHKTHYAPSAPPYVASAPPQVGLYSAPAPGPAAPYMPPSAYPAPSGYPSYPPNSAAYPPSPYAHSQPTAYPPQPYPPHSAYPPPPYSQPPQSSPYYPPGPYPGAYPPPPY